MGNSSRRPAEEEIKLNSSSQHKETEQEYQQRILKFIRENVIQQRTANGKEDANSFGEIEFEGFDKFKNKRAPYVRVADDTNIDILWKLMIKEWEIPEPKMIISLTGGAQHFVGWNEDRLKILFNQGLVKAAINTDAWIITGGSAAGLMQKLGKAITEERQLEEEKGKKVVALGIADWNNIKNNYLLTNSSNEGLWPAKYHKHDQEPKRDGDGFTPALDCNHTHFILVDGARGSYSPDITLRAKFERYIQRHGGTELRNVDAKSPGEETTITPVVLMVVEGGYGTIEIVHQSLGQRNADGESHTVDGIPVVIVGGSGRAADIIAKALRQKDKIEPNDFLKKDIRDILGGNENQVDDCVKLLEEIRRHRKSKLVTVFEMDDANLDNIDEAILRAVLTMPALSGKVQLDLAVELNKSDIARDEILKPDKLSYWKGKLDFLQRTVFWTLRDNKADFVELLLTYLVDMDTFVTKKWLEELYYAVIYGEINDADRIISTRHILQEKFEDDKGRVKFKDVNCLFLKLTNDEYGNLYKEDECGEPDKEKFDPDKQLFMWAVLLNRRALAILLWKRLATGNIGAALIASRILGALAVYAEKIKDLRLQSSLKKHAKEFEDLAIHLLESCYEDNAKRSEMILVRTLPAWGETTCLSIAYSAKLMNFMKCDCCQRKVYDVWMGNLSIYSWKQWLKFFVGIILPIFPLMSFRGTKRREDLSSKTKSFANYFLRCGYNYRDIEFEDLRSGFGKKDVTFWEGMRYFYTAPITKFVYSLVRTCNNRPRIEHPFLKGRVLSELYSKVARDPYDQCKHCI